MARPQGSRTVLVRITYDTIAELAGDIAGDAAKRCAQRGQYDSRDLESMLRWVNARRTAQGQPPIGLVADNASEAEAHSDDDPEQASTPLRMEASPLFYDPRVASYRVNDT